MSIRITIRSLYILILLSLTASLKGYSQTVTVGSYAEELLRREQVAGNTDSISSFVIRPLTSTVAGPALQSLISSHEYLKFNFMGMPSGLRILPFNWLNEYNVNRPYGYNNSSLYPNAGYQSMLSGGFLLKAGILNVQIKPELVYAQNKNFSTFADVQARKQFAGTHGCLL
ncbi:hypothetical protein ACFJIV_15630 [Mucilaginibacter sp. UC70_90]